MALSVPLGLVVQPKSVSKSSKKTVPPEPGVAVGGTEVAVGGTDVAVGGTEVAVGGTGVAVGGTGVFVGGGTTVGIGVLVCWEHSSLVTVTEACGPDGNSLIFPFETASVVKTAYNVNCLLQSLSFPIVNPGSTQRPPPK